MLKRFVFSFLVSFVFSFAVFYVTGVAVHNIAGSAGLDLSYVFFDLTITGLVFFIFILTGMSILFLQNRDLSKKLDKLAREQYGQLDDMR